MIIDHQYNYYFLQKVGEFSKGELVWGQEARLKGLSCRFRYIFHQHNFYRHIFFHHIFHHNIFHHYIFHHHGYIFDETPCHPDFCIQGEASSYQSSQLGEVPTGNIFFFMPRFPSSFKLFLKIRFFHTPGSAFSLPEHPLLPDPLDSRNVEV